MIDTTKTYYFGVATDEPIKEKNKRQYCPYAINDLVYYYEPGSNRGQISTVIGYSYDKDGKVIIDLEIGATMEKISTTLARVRC